MIDPMTDPAVRGPLLADTQATGAVHALAVLLATATVGRTRLPADLMTPRAQALALALGAAVEADGTTVRGRGLGGLIPPEAPLDVRGWPEAGAVLAGLLASHPVTAVVVADALPEGLGAVLEAVGARVIGPGSGAGPGPLTVQGTERAMGAPAPEAAEPWPLGLARLAAGLNTAGRTQARLPPGPGGAVADVLAAFGVPVTVTPDGAGVRVSLLGEAETRPARLPADWPARPAWMGCLDGMGGTPVTVAVDGPAAAGKGTLARALAACLGFAYLDTGLLYRATGMAVRRAGGDPGNPATAEAAARALQPTDLSAPDLRGETAGDAASRVAAIPAVRAALLDFQRSVAATPPDGAKGAVLDGRDIGSVVCPDAAVKLFVTARPDIRARRRFLELRERDGTVIETAILQDMKARDARDSSRGVAPLVPAADAVVLDTSDMDRADALAAALAVTGQALRARAGAMAGTVTADGAGHQTGDS